MGEVDAVNGAFMLVRREALEHVGLLDEGYWLYMEDLDWCRRFWDRGWKVVYDGTASASSTSRAAPPAPTARCARTWPSTAAWGASTAATTQARGRCWTLAVYAGIGAKLAVVGHARRDRAPARAVSRRCRCVVVNYGRRDLLRDCLATLAQSVAG